MNRRQLTIWLAVIAIGAIVITLRSTRSSSDLRGFHSVWVANWEQPAVENRPDREDPYAPSFYAIFAPFGALPLWGAALLFYVVNIACTWGILRLTVRLLEIPPPKYQQLWIPAVAVTPFFIGTISLGQNTLLLLFLVLAAFVVSRQRRDVLAGVLIGLAAAIKVYPLLFLAPFALRRRYKVLLGCASTIVLISGGLGTLFFGYETNVQWHRQWGRFITRADAERPEDPFYPRSLRCTARYNNQAAQAVLARVMLDVPAKWYGKQFKVNLFSLESATWRTARATFAVLFLGLGVVALWGLQRGESATFEMSPSARELGLVCVWFFLVSPMVWTHYLLWAFFPLAYVVFSQQARPRSSQILLCIWFLGEAFVWSKYSRAIGVNLLANLALFTWFAWPGLTVFFRHVMVWRDGSPELADKPTSGPLHLHPS